MCELHLSHMELKPHALDALGASLSSSGPMPLLEKLRLSDITLPDQVGATGWCYGYKPRFEGTRRVGGAVVKHLE